MTYLNNYIKALKYTNTNNITTRKGGPKVGKLHEGTHTITKYSPASGRQQ